MKIGGLGKGLGALLSEMPQAMPLDANSQNGVLELPITQIDPNREQPRKQFDEAQLQELAQSIKSSGIIQPLVVSRKNDRYVIVAGERRYRAARLAGLASVPVVIRNYGEEQLMELALIENIQREDLNPLEQAAGMKLLMEQHDLTQDEVSKRLGKSRSAVANTVRLLSLGDTAKNMLMQGELSAGHARALLIIQDEKEQDKLVNRIVSKKLSVREVEEICKKPKILKSASPSTGTTDALLLDAQANMETALQTKVKLVGDQHKGKIVIEYYDNTQLQHLYDFLTGQTKTHTS